MGGSCGKSTTGKATRSECGTINFLGEQLTPLGSENKLSQKAKVT